MENTSDPFENFRVPLIDRETLRYIDDDDSYFLSGEERGSCYGLIMNDYSNSESTEENKENNENNKNASSLRRSFSTGDLEDKINKKIVKLKASQGTKRQLESPETPNRKFISLAQQVNAFHFKTPDRYKKQLMKPKLQYNPPVRTEMPKTPYLRTKIRHRPPLNVLSEKEREDLIVEEMKRNQFKATEINHGILNGFQSRVKVDKKPNTKPEPFNLTKIKQTLPNIEEPSYKFTANPLPEKILKNVVGVKAPAPKPVTMPKTPNFKIKPKPRTVENPNPNPKPSEPSSTKNTVKPFSFESRDLEMMKKKDEKIKKYLEEEKKAREFKANPLPKYFNKNKACDLSSTTSSSSIVDSQADDVYHFKARPAVVLQKKPFEPKKAETVIEVKPFALNLEQRLEKRHEFDEKIRCTQTKLNQLKQIEEEEKRRREEIEIRELRKTLVHEPQPIYTKPFALKHIKTEITVPMTPPVLKRNNL